MTNDERNELETLRRAFQMAKTRERESDHRYHQLMAYHARQEQALRELLGTLGLILNDAVGPEAVLDKPNALLLRLRRPQN